MKNLVEKFKKFCSSAYPIFALLYYAGNIITSTVIWIFAVLALFATAVVGFLNRTDRSNISEILDPFGALVPDEYVRLLVIFRWQIAVVAGLIIFVGAVRFLRRSRSRSKAMRCVDDISRSYYEHLVKLRDFTIKSKDKGSLTPERYEALEKEIASEIFIFLQNSITRLSSFFELYTGQRCHVSLKILRDGSIKTHVREASAVPDRSTIDEHLKSYSYTENTAFAEIIDNKKSTYFMSNRLRLRKIFGRYSNKNEDWQNFYNATIVVPITPKSHGKEINEGSVWGFLCVDNKGGGFDKHGCRHILLACSRMHLFALQISSKVAPGIES